MELDSVRAMERRISAVNELLKTEIAYRERVDRIQNQLTDMINMNTVGKNVLEKALDLLNESHEEECFAIKQEMDH
jgi:Trp operon repressor